MIPGSHPHFIDFAFRALNDPPSISRADVERLEGELPSLDWYGAIGAALLKRPDLARESTVARLAAVAAHGDSSRLRRASAMTMLSLAAGPLGPAIIAEVERLLLGPRAPGLQLLVRIYSMLCDGWIERVSPEALHRIAARRKSWGRILAWHGILRLDAALGKPVRVPGVEPVFAHFARAVLDCPAPRVLYTHSDAGGVGDEMSHASTLLDAWLEASPTLTIDVIPIRVFIYTHPRVRVIGLAAAEPHYDLVIHFGRPLTEARGRLEICMVGRFHLGSLRFEGREIKLPPRVQFGSNNGYYATGWQLMAALGFQIHAGRGSRESVIAYDGEDARAEWDALTGGASKVCIFHLFGGTYPRKGLYQEEYDAARDWLIRLVRDGYRVIALPARNFWSTRERLDEMIAPLSAEVKAAIAIPAGAIDGEMMKRIRYFAARSDLVVAVEGWLVHLAYALGRPFEVVVLEPWYLSGTGSMLTHWVPGPRRADQRMAAPLPQLDEACWPRHMLKAALTSLIADWGDPRGAQWAFDQLKGSRTTRAANLMQLMRRCMPKDHSFDGAARSTAERWIDHPKPRLRAEAAKLMLFLGADLSDRFGPGYREALETFVWLGYAPFGRPAVRERVATWGEGARLALTIALKDDELAPYHDRVRLTLDLIDQADAEATAC